MGDPLQSMHQGFQMIVLFVCMMAYGNAFGCRVSIPRGIICEIVWPVINKNSKRSDYHRRHRIDNIAQEDGNFVSIAYSEASGIFEANKSTAIRCLIINQAIISFLCREPNQSCTL